MSELPPKSGAEYAAWVSAVDRDGNELAGVRPVELRAPLAPVTGTSSPLHTRTSPLLSSISLWRTSAISLAL